MAAIFAATGNGGQTSGSFVMQNASKLYDVISGTNGTCGTILCKAGTGWDGPTGYGTPNAMALMAQNTGGTGSGSNGGDTGGGTGPGPGGGGGNGAQGVSDGDVVGGCAAGGSGAGLGAILALGFVAARRRRR
jgi:uncharacterized protein (TIGR03382 family)